MTNRKPYDIAFRTSLVCLLILIALAVTMLIAEELISKPDPATFEGFLFVKPLALLVVAVFGLSIVALWVEGWKLLARDWQKRSSITNYLLIFILVVGPVFAAYGFHIYEGRRVG